MSGQVPLDPADLAQMVIEVVGGEGQGLRHVQPADDRVLEPGGPMDAGI